MSIYAGFKCGKCKKIMTEPVTTPCSHNFCKACLQGAFAGMISLIKQRTCQGRRTLRSQKNVMKCPNCPQDIAEFIQNPQVWYVWQAALKSTFFLAKLKMLQLLSNLSMRIYCCVNPGLRFTYLRFSELLIWFWYN